MNKPTVTDAKNEWDQFLCNETMTVLEALAGPFINWTLQICYIYSSHPYFHFFLSLLPLLPADVEVCNLNQVSLLVALGQRNHRISATALLRSIGTFYCDVMISQSSEAWGPNLELPLSALLSLIDWQKCYHFNTSTIITAESTSAPSSISSIICPSFNTTYHLVKKCYSS